MFNAVGSEICHLVLMMRDWGGGELSRERYKKNDLTLRRCTHLNYVIFLYSYFFAPVTVIDDFFKY